MRACLQIVASELEVLLLAFGDVHFHAHKSPGDSSGIPPKNSWLFDLIFWRLSLD